MAESTPPLPLDPHRLALRAAARLEGARRQLDHPAVVDAPVEVAARFVDAAAESLTREAAVDSCPHALRTILLDWRDRLGSHVLTARALGELEVHPDLARQLLRRGLDEILGEAPSRLVDLQSPIEA
jgi:hypothetical protein